MGESLDRVASLMKALEGSDDAGRPKRPVRIDHTVAGLLDSSFELGGDALGLFLLDEHDIGFRPRSVLGRPSACIGRKRELGALRAYSTSASTGRSRAR